MILSPQLASIRVSGTLVTLLVSELLFSPSAQTDLSKLRLGYILTILSVNNFCLPKEDRIFYSTK